MRFCVTNLGCKVNRVEADGFERLLTGAGGVPAPERDADLIVVNTCTVTSEADKKTRKAVRGAVRANDHAQVVVTGCAAAIDAAVFEQMSPRVAVVPKANMSLWLEDWVTHDPREDGALCVTCAHERTAGVFVPSRTRVGVKVQDGCDNACTYCIVHVARGRAVSRAAKEVVSECAALAAGGAREIVLSGINLGSYDDNGTRLTTLLEALLAATDGLHAPGEPPCRFRVSSIEPADVSDDFIELLAHTEGRICRHLHLPLQSGSTKVLHEMARPYDAAGFCQLAERLRRRVPSLSLTTDVIVGFPGETDDDFRLTLDVCRRCGFSKIHVFPYSRRAGTPAAARSDQVAPEVKSARARILRQVSSDLRKADLAARAGTCELALVEESGRAMTESYHEVRAPEGARIGSLVSVEL